MSDATTTEPQLVDPDSLRSPLQIRTAALITAIVGIVHAVLLLVAFLIIKANLPTVDAPDAEFQAFYADENRRRLVLFAALYLVPFAGIAYIWFTVALRSYLRSAIARLNRLLADVLLVTGIIYVALLFCNGAAISVISVDPYMGDDVLAIPLARQFPHYGASLFLIFAMRMTAMTVFALSNIARSTTIFPRWFVLTGAVVGTALLLTSSINPWLVAVFPIWLIVFCSFVILHTRALPGTIGPTGAEAAAA